MKILTGIDLPFSPNCGSMILANDLYSNLPKGISVRFLALAPSTPNDWTDIKDVQLLRIKKEINPEKYPTYVNSLSKEIEKHVSEFRPDVIHVQHLSFGMALALSNIPLPKIAICHGTDIQFALQSNFHKQNIVEIYNKSQKIIFPTKRIFNEFVELTVFKKKSVIIPWGIPDEICIRPICRPDSVRRKILYAGRLDANKNVDTIINSMRFIDPTIHLTVIGDGDQKDFLINLVKKYNLESRITFLDFLPRKILWKKLTDFDAIVVSTKKIEAFCLVAVEAQAHGLPVIYSKTNGLIEVVGKSGISFKVQDSEELAKIVNRLLFNEKLIKKYSLLGKRNAKRYKISKTRKLFLKVSRELLNGNEGN
mgnify:CR=1 FL=1